MKKAVFIGLLCLMVSSIYSQTNGTVLFKTKPPLGATLIKIADTLLTQRQSSLLQLPPGTYPIELWSNGYLLKDSILTVQADSLLVFETRLTKDPIYEQYIIDKKAYQTAKNHLITIPNALTVIGAASAVTLYTTTLNVDKKVEELHIEYLQAGPTSAQVDVQKNALSNYKKNVILRRNISYGLATGTLIFLHFRKMWRNKFHNNYAIPSYHSKSPFSIGVIEEAGNTGLALKFSF